MAINNDGLLLKYKQEICPPELKLTSDNKEDQQVNYLDLHIEVNEKRIYYELYDKRDKFDFIIVNFPNLSGNIPTSESYNVFYSQLIRYARGCQRLCDFKSRALKLVGKLLLQHF